MTETQQPFETYRGNCHCGNFVFEIKLPEIKVGYDCNCSICTKKGYCWNFAPARNDAFNVVKGDERDLQEYTFGNGDWTHKFCSNCGTGLMARCESMPAGKNHVVNIRALQQPFNLWDIERKSFDGQALPPKYDPTVYTGPEPKAGLEDSKIHFGSCHCGAVKLAVKHKPVEMLDISKDDEKIIECNCSICQRGAYIWIYPKRDHSELQGADNLTYYVMGSGVWAKAFCKSCGVHIMNEINPMTDEEILALPQSTQTWRAIMKDYRPINVRAFNDLDVNVLETRKVDGYHIIKPLYVNP